MLLHLNELYKNYYDCKHLIFIVISPFIVVMVTDEDLGTFLLPLNLPSKQFVFLPVNDNQISCQVGGTHW